MTGLINQAVSYVTDSGLRFNPSKTKRLVFGSNPFVTKPTWSIGDNILSIENNITYLGVEISGPTNRNHSAKRVRCPRQAFYALQNAETAMTIFKTAVNSTLAYGCHSIHLNRRHLKEQDTIQSKFLECILGLNKFSRSSHL